MAKKFKAPKDDKEELDLIALKDWHILSGSWNRETDKMEYDIVIKKGERFSVPRMFIPNLKTEGVI